MNCTCTPYDMLKPFRYSFIQSIDEGQFGIYGFWFKRRCLYIGKAEKQPIKVRLTQHWKDCHNDYLKLWISAKRSNVKIAYVVIERKEDIHKAERYYIKRFKPIANKTS